MGEVEKMETQTSPLSYTVSSPRRTLSLLKRKKRIDKIESVIAWEESERNRIVTKPADDDSGLAGLKTSEVYGFVGAISTIIASGVFFLWAYTPETWLHWLGITYYPSKYWALAIPAYAMVTVVLCFVFYLGLNFMITPSPTSINTVFDEYNRDPIEHDASDENVDRPIEPISDIGICEINDLMFGTA